MHEALAAALFADGTLARPAVYTPPDGAPPLDCRAVAAPLPDPTVSYDHTVLAGDLRAAKLLRSAVPAPAEGGVLAVDGWGVFRLVGAPVQHLHGRVWLVLLRPDGTP